MKPRVSFITLAVSDLEKSLVFYRDGMGLPTEGIIGTEFEDGAVAFFKMNDNLTLALFPKPSLAKDAKVPIGPTTPPTSGGATSHDSFEVQASREVPFFSENCRGYLGKLCYG
jgi:uncharacterized protein